MKKIILLLIGLVGLTQAVSAQDFDENYRFIFYAVMEGCYEDGIATTNVDQILLTQPYVGYVHFVYGCPICTPTIHALKAYRARPESLFPLKTHATTFGPGLSADQIKKLYSDRPTERLEVINGLMKNWIARRVGKLRLNDEEKAKLNENFQRMRKEGMIMLPANPALAEAKQCAACNGACGMNLWPQKEKPAAGIPSTNKP